MASKRALKRYFVSIDSLRYGRRSVLPIQLLFYSGCVVLFTFRSVSSKRLNEEFHVANLCSSSNYPCSMGRKSMSYRTSPRLNKRCSSRKCPSKNVFSRKTIVKPAILIMSIHFDGSPYGHGGSVYLTLLIVCRYNCVTIGRSVKSFEGDCEVVGGVRMQFVRNPRDGVTCDPRRAREPIIC